MWGASPAGTLPWGALAIPVAADAPLPAKGPIRLPATATPPTALQARATAPASLVATATAKVSIVIGLEVPDV